VVAPGHNPSDTAAGPLELSVEALCGTVIDVQKVPRLLKALSPQERKLVRKKVAERNAELEARVLSRYYPFGLKF
jgi:hypothetical protein